VDLGAARLAPPDGPRLPGLMAIPLGLVPGSVHSRLLATALNWAFAHSLSVGEFGALHGRRFLLRLVDAPVCFSFTLDSRGFRETRIGGQPDLVLSGTLADLLRLVCGREDPDALFFHRRLRMEGDTALGLEVKNLLAAFDPDRLPAPVPVRRLFAEAARICERLLS
jgi:predicted lipid carrier protein YhbT